MGQVLSAVLTGISALVLAGNMVNMGCQKTGKCRNPTRDLPEAMFQCTGNWGSPDNLPCLFTTDKGEPFVMLGSSVDVYIKHFQAAPASSPEQCLTMCAETAGCIGSRYDGNVNCFMTGNLSSDATTTLAEFAQAGNSGLDELSNALGIKDLPTLRSCGVNVDAYCNTEGANGCITANGFNVRCARGFLGNEMSADVQQQGAITLTACMDHCKNTDGCVAVTFKPEGEIKEQGKCFLKDQLFAGIENVDLVGAYITVGERGEMLA